MSTPSSGFTLWGDGNGCGARNRLPDSVGGDVDARVQCVVTGFVGHMGTFGNSQRVGAYGEVKDSRTGVRAGVVGHFSKV